MWKRPFIYPFSCIVLESSHLVGDEVRAVRFPVQRNKSSVRFIHPLSREVLVLSPDGQESSRVVTQQLGGLERVKLHIQDTFASPDWFESCMLAAAQRHKDAAWPGLNVPSTETTGVFLRLLLGVNIRNISQHLLEVQLASCFISVAEMKTEDVLVCPEIQRSSTSCRIYRSY